MKHPTCWLVVLALTLVVWDASAQSLFGPESTPRRSRTVDMLHYRLVLSFDEKARRVIGSATIRLTPLSGPVDSVQLDAVAMDVRSVTVNSARKRIGFRNRSPVLTVMLDRTYEYGETLGVTIEYSCAPEKGLYFVRPDTGAMVRHAQIWTQGEDMDNRYWFPSYDYPNDKATSEVIATVREEYTLLSNGRLVGEVHDRARRERTFHWRQSRPHSSYLIMLAAGTYTAVRDRYRDVPLLYYVYPEDTAKVKQTFGRTADMMRFFEEWTGVPYPWEKFAQIVIDDFMWGGMENTSAVTLNTVTITDARAALDFPSDGVVAHELAHQWWGNLVTCRDWTHLWLHEGFATYFEALYTEAAQGRDEFQQEMIQASFQIRTNDGLVGRSPIVSRESNPTNLYARGAWVLHMLRGLLGDDAFRRGLRAYLAAHAYGCVETNDLKLAFEDATGQNLDWFFEQWVYQAGLPQLRVDKEWDASAGELRLVMTQQQRLDSLTGVFRLPVWVECTTRRGVTQHLLWVTQRVDTFHVPVDGPPLMVIVDKGYRLLKELEFPKGKEEFMYQLVNAQDVADRITAARSLSSYDKDVQVTAALKAAALGDRFWGVRQAALVALSEMPGFEEREVFERAVRDVRSLVRNTAAQHLGGIKHPSSAALLDSLARHDSSYVVVSTCIRGLASVDSARGFALACDMIGRLSARDLLRTASLVALRMLGDPRSVDVILPFTTLRYDADTRSLATAALGKAGRSVPRAHTALLNLLKDNNASVRTAAVESVAEWSDGEMSEVLRAMEGGEKNPGVRNALRRALAPSSEEERQRE